MSQYLFRVKNSKALHRTFNVDPLYLQYDKKGLAIDFMVCCPVYWKLRSFPQYVQFLSALASSIESKISFVETVVCHQKLRCEGITATYSEGETNSISRIMKCSIVPKCSYYSTQNVALAKHFELLIRDDERFEIPARRHLGMVVFRLKGQNELTENLLKRLNSTGSCLNVICQVPCGKFGSKI